MVLYLPYFAPLRRRVTRRVRVLIPLLVLAGTFHTSTSARADEWSVVPTNDPIYRQLAIIDQFGDGKKVAKGLTRYEAALQVARAITFSGSDATALPRTGWRALRELTESLRVELTQLGIDVNATLMLCDKNLAGVSPKSESVSVRSKSNSSSGGSLSLQPRSNLFGSANRSALLGGAGTPQQDAARGLALPSFRMALAPQLSADMSALMLNSNSVSPLTPGVASRVVGSSTNLAYDLNQWLRLRAGTTQRDLLNDPSSAPLFNAPFFQGAGRVGGAGGGVDLTLGSLSFSTNVQSLGTDTGERGTLLGGGVKLSAGDRLSLSADFSSVKSQDKSAPVSTGTEFGVGLSVTQRLRLNLIYQSLFTQQSTANESRVSGGLSMSF